MAKIGRFDPGLGIQGLSDGREEIGRVNLPAAARLIPESAPDPGFLLVYGRITDSTLQERFLPYLNLEVRHRELLSPDVFFETLEHAAESFKREGEGGDGKPRKGAMADAALAMAEVLADRDLCEMLRNLVLKA